jgi:hypothetical protein
MRLPVPHTLKVMLMFSRLSKSGDETWLPFKEAVRVEYARDRSEAIDRIMRQNDGDIA